MPQLGFDPQTVQRVVSSFSDYTIPVHAAEVTYHDNTGWQVHGKLEVQRMWPLLRLGLFNKRKEYEVMLHH